MALAKVHVEAQLQQAKDELEAAATKFKDQKGGAKKNPVFRQRRAEVKKIEKRLAAIVKRNERDDALKAAKAGS